MSQLPTPQCSDSCNTPSSDYLTTIQFIGQGRLLAVLKSANLNTTNDQAISVPTGNWVLSEVIVANASGTSANAVGGIYDAVNKGGNAVVANTQTYTSVTGGASYEVLTPSAYANANKFTASTVYFSLTTPEGSALTADVFIYYWDLDPVEEIVTQASDCNCKRNFLIQHSGVNGTDGTNGIDGINAFTATTAAFAMPAPAGTVSVSVLDTSWMVPGQIIYVQFAGYMEVSSVTNSTTVVLENIDYTGNAAPATVIPISSKVSPGGVEGPEGPEGDQGPAGDPGTPGVATVHGQCRLTSSTNDLLLIPYNGNTLVIDGTGETIPDAGVTLTSAGAADDTVYFIYAYMDTGTMTLEYSTTGHETEAGTGVEIMIGDSTRTYVGLARTSTGTWAFAQNNLYLISWFNKGPRMVQYPLLAPISKTSATYVAVTATPVNFLCFAGDTVQVGACGAVAVNTAASYARTSLRIDAGSPLDCFSENQAPAASANYRMGFGITVPVVGLSEDEHTLEMIGLADANTATWSGDAAIGARTNLWAIVQG